MFKTTLNENRPPLSLLKLHKPSGVLKLLSKLDVNKATGLDQICNKIPKQDASVIFRQLADFVQPVTCG